MEPESVKGIEQALERECGHERCLGRDALIEAARIVEEPDGWTTETEDGQMRLYALIRGTIHVISADCKPAAAAAAAESAETATAKYGVLPRLTGQEEFGFVIERSEGGPRGTEATIRWSFELPTKPMRIEHLTGMDAASEAFARQLANAIIGAREA